MTIDKEFIQSVSINSAAIKNGTDLVKKNNFANLNIDKDKTFISGECAGSGKNPYFCSADFINADSPVFRCSCPSRQIPCKHVIGLMIAFAEGHVFSQTEIPEDITNKREAKEKRATKVKEKSDKEAAAPPKEKTAAWKKSATKKIDAQLTGIEEATKVLHTITQFGIGVIDAKAIKNYSTVIKQLDSYFIPAIQNEFNDLLGLITGSKEQNRITEKLCQIHTLLAKAKTYLEAKREAPDTMDVTSEIEELIGHAWKLTELEQHNMIEKDARLVELAFHVRQEYDKKQFVDESFYISLNSGKIYKTRNYRPFRAAKYIKEQDSNFTVINLPKLYVYPSLAINPRVRWEDSADNIFEKISPTEYKQIKVHAQSDFAEVIKAVKNQLKNLLLFPYPAMLVKFDKISKIANSEMFVIEDSTGSKICLQQGSYCQENFIFLLDSLLQSESENNAMLLLFENDIANGKLFAHPLALVTDEKIIRLAY